MVPGERTTAVHNLLNPTLDGKAGEFKTPPGRIVRPLPGRGLPSCPSFIQLTRMFRKKILSALLLLLTVASLSSCNNETEPTPAAPSMECKINNVSWKAATFNNTLVAMSSTMYAGKRLDIRGNRPDGSFIILSISEPNTNVQGGIKPDTYYTNVLRNLPPNYVSGTPVKGAIGTYMSLLTQQLHMSDPEVTEGQIVITACDATKKTVSGTFFFKTTDFDASSLDITSGTFTNLSYTLDQ